MASVSESTTALLVTIGTSKGAATSDRPRRQATCVTTAPTSAVLTTKKGKSAGRIAWAMLFRYWLTGKYSSMLAPIQPPSSAKHQKVTAMQKSETMPAAM